MARIKKLRGRRRRSRQRFTFKMVFPHALVVATPEGSVNITALSDLTSEQHLRCRQVTFTHQKNGLGQFQGRTDITFADCPIAAQQGTRNWLFDLLTGNDDGNY